MTDALAWTELFHKCRLSEVDTCELKHFFCWLKKFDARAMMLFVMGSQYLGRMCGS